MKAISAAIKLERTDKTDTRGASNSSVGSNAIYNSLRPKVGSPPSTSKAGGFASSGDLSSSGEISNTTSNGTSPLLIRTKLTQWEKRTPTSLGSSPVLESSMNSNFQLKESQAFVNFEESDDSDSEGALSWPEDNPLEKESYKRYGSSSAPNTPATSPVGSPLTNNTNILAGGVLGSSFSAGVHRTFNEEQKKDLAKEDGTEEIVKKLRGMEGICYVYIVYFWHFVALLILPEDPTKVFDVQSRAIGKG